MFKYSTMIYLNKFRKPHGTLVLFQQIQTVAMFEMYQCKLFGLLYLINCIHSFYYTVYCFFISYLKYGSYPVINPDGAEYPSHFRIHQSPIYDTNFVSDGSHHIITVTSPTPGDWYAVAFLPITRARITQKVSLTSN